MSVARKKLKAPSITQLYRLASGYRGQVADWADEETGAGLYLFAEIE